MNISSYYVYGKDINNVRHIIIAATNWHYPEGSNIYQCLTMCGKESAICILDEKDNIANFVCPKCQKYPSKTTTV